ncbi:MAG: hypothetical protein J7M18_07115 [Candidatus Eremiobacteraeota bacterium]|nr:hypothetical protein [Candidatus Eremiobacteraeota bacterium]
MNKKTLFLMLAIIILMIIPADTAKPIFVIDFRADYIPQNVDVTIQSGWDTGEYLVLYSPRSALVLYFDLPQGTTNILGLKLTIVDRATYNDMPDTISQANGGVYSPIRIIANGKVVVDNVDLRWVRDHTFSYPVGQYLKTGRNRISIEVLDSARTQYEIRRISLNY